MDTIILPKFDRIIFQQPGCKNEIKQLLAPEIILPIDIIENNRSYVTIDKEGVKYCLTCNPKSYSNEA